MAASQTGPRTFVLIPGAGGAASWYWHRVVPLLRQAGHETIIVPDLMAQDRPFRPGLRVKAVKAHPNG